MRSKIFEDMGVFDSKAFREPADDELQDACKKWGVAVVDLTSCKDEEARNRQRNVMKKQLLECQEKDLEDQVHLFLFCVLRLGVESGRFVSRNVFSRAPKQ